MAGLFLHSTRVFQVYSPVIHDLSIALCTHHPKPPHLPSPCIWVLFYSECFFHTELLFLLFIQLFVLFMKGKHWRKPTVQEQIHVTTV